MSIKFGPESQTHRVCAWNKTSSNPLGMVIHLRWSENRRQVPEPESRAQSHEPRDF